MVMGNDFLTTSGSAISWQIWPILSASIRYANCCKIAPANFVKIRIVNSSPNFFGLWCNFWNLLFLQLFEGLNQYIGAINVRTRKLTVIFADYPPNFDDPYYSHILTLTRGLSWHEILKCTKPPFYARAELIVVTKCTHNEIIKKFHRVFMRIH